MYHQHQKIEQVGQVIEIIKQMRKQDPIQAERYLDFKLLTYKISDRIKELKGRVMELQATSGEGREKYLSVWRTELANFELYQDLIASGIVTQNNYYLYEMDATKETPSGTKTKRVKPFVTFI